MKTPERSVGEILEQMPVASEVCDGYNNCIPDTVYISDVRKALQAERQKRDELVEATRYEIVEAMKLHAFNRKQVRLETGLVRIVSMIEYVENLDLQALIHPNNQK